MKQTLILLGLATAVICDSGIKQRLGQVKAKTLAEQSCECSIPLGAVGGINPTGLSQGTYNSFATGASTSLGQTVQTIPDVAQTETVVSEACSCSEGSSQSTATGTIGKHYQLAGAIEVSESVEYGEVGGYSSSGSGSSHKQAACIVNNANGTTSGSGSGNCASACLVSSGNGAASASYSV